MKKLVLMFLVSLVMSCGTKKEEKIEEVKEGSVSEKVVKKGNEPINVGIEVKYYFENQKLYIESKTNLPEETELMVIVSNESGYFAQDRVKVENGGFKTNGFTNKGKPLTGQYTIEISTPMPEAQDSAAVKEKIGINGEFLIGKNVKEEERIGTGEKYNSVQVAIEMNTKNIEKKEENVDSQVKKRYNELISFYSKKSSFVESGKFNKDFIRKINEEKEKHKDDVELYAAYGDLITLAMELDNRNLGQKYSQEFINFVENNMKNFE